MADAPASGSELAAIFHSVATQLDWADVLAPVFFLAVWGSYRFYADVFVSSQRSLMRRMHEYRTAWLRQMLVRENRMVDVQVVRALMSNASFFASSAVLITGGFVAVLGAGEAAMNVVLNIPFAQRTTLLLWELKLVLLIVIFVYAFFKFTWSLRLFNYAAVLIGAAPAGLSPEALRYADRTARIVSRAGDHSNRALRAFYFGLAAMTWFIQPWLFVMTSIGVVLVLYRREFRSNVVAILGPVGEPIPGDVPGSGPGAETAGKTLKSG